MGRELRREIRRLRVQLEFVPTRPKLLRWLPGYWTKEVMFWSRLAMLVTGVVFFFVFLGDYRWWLVVLCYLGVCLVGFLLSAVMSDLVQRPFLGRYLLPSTAGSFCDFERPWKSVRDSEPKIAVAYLRYVCEEATAFYLQLEHWGVDRLDARIQYAIQVRYREAWELEDAIRAYPDTWDRWKVAELTRTLEKSLGLGDPAYVAQRNRRREAELALLESDIGSEFDARPLSEARPIASSLGVLIIRKLRIAASTANG